MTLLNADSAAAAATIQSVAWLVSLTDALDTGVLTIAPSINPNQRDNIHRELWLLRSLYLPRMHEALGTSPAFMATGHLRQWAPVASSDNPPQASAGCGGAV